MANVTGKCVSSQCSTVYGAYMFIIISKGEKKKATKNRLQKMILKLSNSEIGIFIAQLLTDEDSFAVLLSVGIEKLLNITEAIFELGCTTCMLKYSQYSEMPNRK